MKKGEILWERKLNNEFPLPTLEEELGLRLVEDLDVPVDHDFEAGILSDQVFGIMKDTATPRETHAVRIRYLYDKTLVETGEQFDVSPERIRQMIRKGIRKTRGKLNIDPHW